MSALTSSHAIGSNSFSHEAMLYADETEFVDGTVSFIREGLAAEEPVLVVLRAPKIDLLREELDAQAADVHFADMAVVGTNPARIIPAWRQFVSDRVSARGRGRGIGEPIWAERSPAELIECQRHEALLNLAFAGGAPWALLCPYDTEALHPSVIDEARRTHPLVVKGQARAESATYRGLDELAAPFGVPLPEPPSPTDLLAFGVGSLPELRAFVAAHAAAAHISAARIDDLVLAVNELATNSLRHAGGRGILRAWLDGETLICEVSDNGRIMDPLIGREPPSWGEEGGRGHWLANQLCELVQVRTFADGNVVRVHMKRG